MTVTFNLTSTVKSGILCFGLLWAVLPLVHAEQVANIYTNKILVANQSAETRQQATKKALEQVLVRATGLLASAKDLRLVPILNNADAYVESFLYENSEELIQYRQQAVQASSLVINFSKPVLEKLLRDYGLPVWPANRPSILVWMVQDSRSGRSIPALTNDSVLGASVEKAVSVYGLPLVLPVMDLQDQRSINSDDLWQVNLTKISQASLRYQVDSVVVVRYGQTSSGEWRASWTLFHKDQQTVFDSLGKTQSEFIDDGFSAIMSHMASLYSIVNDGVSGSAVSMSVNGIDAFEDYMSVLNYLTDLAIVKDVVVVSVMADTMKLEVFIDGDLSLLLGALALDRKLEDITKIAIDSYSNTDPSTTKPLPQGMLAPSGSVMNPLRFTWP
jgi:hypothetical protein